MSTFLSAALGAFLGLFAGLALEWWKSDRADVHDLCKDFCDLIAQAADAGAAFCLTAPDKEDAALLAAQIIGFQNRIDGYNTILIDRLPPESVDEIDANLGHFFRSLTGGDHDDPSRKVSMENAIAVHDCAGAAIVSIRRASYEKLSFSGMIGRRLRLPWRSNAQPMLPRPEHPFENSHE